MCFFVCFQAMIRMTKLFPHFLPPNLSTSPLLHCLQSVVEVRELVSIVYYPIPLTIKGFEHLQNNNNLGMIGNMLPQLQNSQQMLLPNGQQTEQLNLQQLQQGLEEMKRVPIFDRI